MSRRGARRSGARRMRTRSGSAPDVLTALCGRCRFGRPIRTRWRREPVSVCDSLCEEFKRDEYAPPPLMKRVVVAGHLGRKAGHGFYEYG